MVGYNVPLLIIPRILEKSGSCTYSGSCTRFVNYFFPPVPSSLRGMRDAYLIWVPYPIDPYPCLVLSLYWSAQIIMGDVYTWECECVVVVMWLEDGHVCCWPRCLVTKCEERCYSTNRNQCLFCYLHMVLGTSVWFWLLPLFSSRILVKTNTLDMK